MGKYICKDCGKKFDQKSHYEAHKNRKIPCVVKDKSIGEFIEDKVKEEVHKELKKKSLKHKKEESEDEEEIEDDILEDVEVKEKKSQKKVHIKKIKKQVEKKKVVIDDTYLRRPTNDIVFEVTKDDKQTKDKQYVLSKIKQAHQILYDAENIEGETAMNDIMNLLFLRLIENKLTDKKEVGKLDLMNPTYYKKEITKKAIEYLDLHKLADAPLEDIRNKTQSDLIKRLGSLLKEHPLTSQIYDEENFIKAEKATTIQMLLKNNILDIDIEKFSNTEDLIGDIYEFFINSYTKGNQSKLSQYFTPRTMMNIVLTYCRDTINENIKDKKEIKVADWCMGTAGWLVTFYNMFKDEYGEKILLSGAYQEYPA